MGGGENKERLNHLQRGWPMGYQVQVVKGVPTMVFTVNGWDTLYSNKRKRQSKNAILRSGEFGSFSCDTTV